MNKQQKTKRIKSTILILIMICLANLPVLAATPTPLQCDINNDGIISVSDLIDMSNHIGATGTPGWIKEDVDKNGIIQVCDLMFVASHYGESVTTTGGTTTGGTTTGGARIQKLSIAYSSTVSSTTNQKFIASHFDMLDCPHYYTDAAANIKVLNSNIKILAYFDALMSDKTEENWNTVNSHEDWFIHSLSGSRIERVVYPGEYLMNPSSGWSTYSAQRFKTFLTTYPQFDGVYLDDAVCDLVDYDYTFKVSYSQFQTGVLSNWESWMISHMSRIKSTVGSDIVMPNCYTGTVLTEQAKAGLWENFVHGRSNAYNDNGYGTSSVLQAIDALHTQAKLGNIIAVNPGCASADSHTVEAKRWMLFTYACFSFAVVDLNKAYYAWQINMMDSTGGYYSEMDMKLGQPMGDYYKVSGTTYVYARQFANYYVAANINSLGTSSVTFTLNGASYTLSPRTAVFIPK